MPKDKTEYPPLLPAGFHEVTRGDLHSLFVAPFDPSKQREYLVSRLLAFMDALDGIGIKYEIWLNGSFVTEKVAPDDIDVAIFADRNEVNALAADDQRRLFALMDNAQARVRYGCDVYFIPRDDEKNRSYWRGWFGFTRAEEPKGIPLIRAA